MRKLFLICCFLTASFAVFQINQIDKPKQIAQEIDPPIGEYT